MFAFIFILKVLDFGDVEFLLKCDFEMSKLAVRWSNFHQQVLGSLPLLTAPIEQQIYIINKEILLF